MHKIAYLSLRFLKLSWLVMSCTLVAIPTTSSTVIAQERVLEVWTHEFPPLQNGMTQKWIPEFEAKTPGVKVKLTAIPFAGVVAFDAKLLAALSGGEGPDLWDMGDWNYKTFIDNKFLAPFDPRIFGYTSDQEMIDAYLPGTMAIFVRDGKVYGLFSEHNTLALFYNLDDLNGASGWVTKPYGRGFVSAAKSACYGYSGS